MSPSWRNRLCMAISPEQVSLVKLGRGWTPKLLASYDEAVAPVNGQPSWQLVLGRLTQILDQPEWQNTEVNIVLSNRLVRYATLLFNTQLQNYSVQEAFARHALTQIYGTAAEQWELRIQQGKGSTPGLVVAVDRALLEGLRQMCAAHKLELRSVTPYLMPVFNHYCKTIDNDPAWLVINEPGYSLCALLNGGEFVAVNGMCHDSISDLPMLLDRENLAGPFAEPCTSVYVHTTAVDNFPAAEGYQFSRIDVALPSDFPPSGRGLYAMAMSGVL